MSTSFAAGKPFPRLKYWARNIVFDELGVCRACWTSADTAFEQDIAALREAEAALRCGPSAQAQADARRIASTIRAIAGRMAALI